MRARPRLAAPLFVLLAACDSAPPARPGELPDPDVQVTTLQSSPGPCQGEWCAYLIVVATTDRTTGEHVAAELHLAGVGRYSPVVHSLASERETSIDWDFPNRDGTHRLSVCPKSGEGDLCTSYKATVFK